MTVLNRVLKFRAHGSFLGRLTAYRSVGNPVIEATRLNLVEAPSLRLRAGQVTFKYMILIHLLGLYKPHYSKGLPCCGLAQYLSTPPKKQKKREAVNLKPRKAGSPQAL